MAGSKRPKKHKPLEISAKHERAASVLAAGGSHQEAAEKADVSKRTIGFWVDTYENFRKLVLKHEAEQILAAKEAEAIARSKTAAAMRAASAAAKAPLPKVTRPRRSPRERMEQRREKLEHYLDRLSPAIETMFDAIDGASQAVAHGVVARTTGAVSYPISTKTLGDIVGATATMLKVEAEVYAEFNGTDALIQRLTNYQEVRGEVVSLKDKLASVAALPSALPSAEPTDNDTQQSQGQSRGQSQGKSA